MATLTVLQYLTDALFVCLAGVCFLRWRRERGRAAAWLATTFGTLAGVVVVGVVLEGTVAGQPPAWALDLHLPDMPGEEVLRRLRNDPRTAEIPVVILSADARPSLIKRLLGSGARAFLTKPLDVAELLALLDQVAEEHEAAASSPA